MIYEVRRHPRVVEDLQAITTLVGDYAGLDSGYRVLSNLEKAVPSLARMPNRGAPRSDIDPNLRILPVGDQATVVYPVHDEHRIVVIRLIAYAGEDWMRRIGTRG